MLFGRYRLIHWRKVEEIQWSLTAAQNSINDAFIILPIGPLPEEVDARNSAITMSLDRAHNKIEEAIGELIEC